jgi:LmbE family N-acetylglucosaminyl deacetylase
LLILGAHPDDAEFSAGGLAAIYRAAGHAVRMISVTDGGAGHHALERGPLAARRRQEAACAGDQIGAEYITWDFPDGELTPSLDVRRRIIQEIRSYRPDLVLTHRANDYHPDHRAVGEAVQDAMYMVTVPLICPETPALAANPVLAYMVDLFTKPCPLEPHVVLDVTDQLDKIAAMLSCHQSQVYEWLPHHDGKLAQVPIDHAARLAWLRTWLLSAAAPRLERFREQLLARYGAERAQRAQLVEAYEISEYAAQPDAGTIERLFPG